MQRQVAKGKKESVKLIRKANDLVEARYKFNIWEMRIFTKMLTMIRREDEDFKEYRIYLRDVINDFDLQRDNASYEWLKDGATRLMKKIITVVRQTEEGTKEFQTPIIAGMDSFVDKRKAKYIDISFHPKMKPYLLQLKSQFLMYDVRYIMQLSSVYSIRVYELLKQYEKIGWRKIEVQELKEILGIADKYKLYGHFKQRVILKSQSDMEKYCDIRFEFEEIKRGRKIESLVFHIFSNHPDEKKETTTESPKKVIEAKISNGKWDDLALVMHAWGIRVTSLEIWANAFGEERVRKAVSYLQERIKRQHIDNPGGYLNHLIREGNFDQPNYEEERKKKLAAEKQRAAKQRALEQEQEEQLNELKRQRVREEIALAEAIFEKEPEQKENMFLKARQRRFSGYDPNLTDWGNFTDNLIFRSAVINEMRKEFPSVFKKVEIDYNASVAELQREWMLMK